VTRELIHLRPCTAALLKNGQVAGNLELSVLRRQVAHETADWLAGFGLLLWRVNWLDDGVAGSAVATQMVGQIGQEAADAYDKERYYAGSCLTRQLVEAHYLLAYFESDTSQAARWRRASKNRLDKSFKPSKLREVLGMDGGEYRTHCALGGHPTPQAAWLLPDHQPLADQELHWVDLQQHLTDAVIRSLRAAAALGAERLGNSLAEGFEQPPSSIAEWLSLTRWRTR
jgi:hypothetical protein